MNYRERESMQRVNFVVDYTVGMTFILISVQKLVVRRELR